MIVRDGVNSAGAKTTLLYSIAATNGQYNCNQAGMKVTGEEWNMCSFSASNPIPGQMSAASFSNSIMVDGLLNADCYNDQAPPQPLPTTYPSTLQNKYRYNMPSLQSHHISHPALAPLPASASALTPNMGCINNNVASLMLSDGNPDDTIDFEQLLVDFRILNPAPRNPSTPMGNALAAVPMQTYGYDQTIQTQGQQFLLQTHISSFLNNAVNASDGDTQMSKRRRRLNPEEAMHRKTQRMIKNRDSAARSRARKSARDKEMQNELDRLRVENEKLKKMLAEATETKIGDKSVRTNSWP